MPKSTSQIRPVAPTRQAEQTQIDPGDRFNKLTYHVAAPDLFLTINRDREPERFVDFIVPKPPVNGRCLLEIYDDQSDFYGVVDWLEFMKLPHSEQHCGDVPQPFPRY